MFGSSSTTGMAVFDCRLVKIRHCTHHQAKHSAAEFQALACTRKKVDRRKNKRRQEERRTGRNHPRKTAAITGGSALAAASPNRLVAAGVRLAGHQHGRSFSLRPVSENIQDGVHGPVGCQHTQPNRGYDCGKQYESCYQRVQGSARLTRFKYSACRYLQPLPTVLRQPSNLPALTLAAIDR